MTTILALALAVLLTACAPPAAMIEVQNAPPPEADGPEMIMAMTLTPAKKREEVIRYEVETVVYGDTERTEDGEHLVSYTFYAPRLTAYREDGTPISERDADPTVEAKKAATDAELHALAVTQAFNEKFEEWTSFGNMPGLAADAAANLKLYQAEGLEWHGGYFLELNCEIYQTDHLISVAGTYYSYTGGAHPNTVQLGWNFDLEEGLFIGPELLADDTGLQEAVAAEIIRQANIPMEDGTIPADEYWEGYEDIAANWSCSAVSFDEQGMTVTFSPYELAYYAMGAQIFQMSYDFLEPYLSDHGRMVLGLETAE